MNLPLLRGPASASIAVPTTCQRLRRRGTGSSKNLPLGKVWSSRVWRQTICSVRSELLEQHLIEENAQGVRWKSAVATAVETLPRRASSLPREHKHKGAAGDLSPLDALDRLILRNGHQPS